MKLPPKPLRCELWWLPVRHSKDLTVQHVIPRAWTRGNLTARHYVDEHEELLAWVCSRCNAATKMADTKSARRYLLKRGVAKYGEDRMRKVVDGIPWKVAKKEWTWEALIAS